MNAVHTVSRVIASLATLAAAGWAPSALAAQQSYADATPQQVTTLSPAPLRSASDRADRDLHPVWTGEVLAPVRGDVRVTLERIGIPESALDPSWPVMVRWEYDARDPSRSFTAELFGSGDANGRMELHGTIVQGDGAGREVAVHVRGGSDNGATLSFVSDDGTP